MSDQRNFKTWMGRACGFIDDETRGLPAEGIAPGTRWDDIPMNWVCPECGACKADFEMVEFRWRRSMMRRWGSLRTRGKGDLILLT